MSSSKGTDSDLCLERYLQDLKRDDFKSDPAQKLAVEHLQRLH
ncbi:MAG: cell division protein ZapE, partial [Candidatus Riflebacteria bacterium]|nr:cell division protein ZapE [Candidatus Riflebacteria bacterium]